MAGIRKSFSVKQMIARSAQQKYETTMNIYRPQLQQSPFNFCYVFNESILRKEKTDEL